MREELCKQDTSVQCIEVAIKAFIGMPIALQFSNCTTSLFFKPALACSIRKHTMDKPFKSKSAKCQQKNKWGSMRNEGFVSAGLSLIYLLLIQIWSGKYV